MLRHTRMEEHLEDQRTLELYPNYAMARYRYAGFSSSQNRSEAVAEAVRALTVDPLSSIGGSGLSTVRYYAGDSEGSVTRANRGLELHLNATINNIQLGPSYAARRP